MEVVGVFVGKGRIAGIAGVDDFGKRKDKKAPQ
jgi:hypothetical protein